MATTFLKSTRTLGEFSLAKFNSRKRSLRLGISLRTKTERWGLEEGWMPTKLIPRIIKKILVWKLEV